MLRSAAFGALVFGAGGLVAGWLWNVTDVPLFVFIPWALGWLLVTRGPFGWPVAWKAGLVGGTSFTVAFLVALFLAITDGSPLPLAGWMAAGIAGAVAGGLTALVVDRGSAAVFAIAAGLGMVVGTVVGGLVPSVAPTAANSPGQVQALAFAIQQGVVSAFAGVGIGIAVSRAVSAKAGIAASGGSATPNDTDAAARGM